MPLRASADLWSLGVVLLYSGAIAVLVLVGFVVGWAVGKNRGLAQAPEDTKRALLNEQQKRLVAEGLLAAEQRASRRIDSALNALTAQPEAVVERQGLRVAGGRG